KREEINSSYRIKGLLERYKEVSQILITSYKDKEEALKVDFKDITPQNSLSTFLKQVDSIKESSRQVGLSSEANTIKPLSAEFSKFAEGRANLNKLVLCEFTGEEGYGRYLDLSMLHIQYNNLPSLPKKLTYVKYLEEFNKFSELDLSIKQSAAYKSYLLSLKNYLVNFVERIQPLLDSKCEIDKISKQFENEWQTNTYKGWTDEYFEKSIKQQSKMLNEPINLALFDKPEQLETLGNEKLRASLSNLGLKSGGTLQEKAIRLFSTKDKPIESLDPSLFPNKKSKHKTKINSVVELKDKLKSVALSEAVICAFTEMLTKEREDTKNDVIRKQSLTAEERLLEQANDV
ncbi:MAG: Splicing factor 3A subunit 3, partial [Marteilia pararefringens]